MLAMNSAARFLGISRTIETLKTGRAGTRKAGHRSRESAPRNSNLQSKRSRKGPGVDEFLGACADFVSPPAHRWMRSLASYLDVPTPQRTCW